jgi:hypothetical protein
VNGSPVNGAVAGQYLAIRRRWNAGDRLELRFDMTPRLLTANPQVIEDNGKVAVQRGPLVYCMEQLDEPAQIGDLLLARTKSGFNAEYKANLLGGILVLKHSGEEYKPSLSTEPLYEPLDKSGARKTQPVELTFIPYYAWANRERTPMEVWVPLDR